MRTIKLSQILLLAACLLSITSCKDREVTNPFDTGCPKELFTPSEFKAVQEGTAVKLTWAQSNLTINGFVINRSENDGVMTEVARIDKAITSWKDTKVIGGTRYVYQLYAYAGANLSNPLQIDVTTSVLGPTVVTAYMASNITSNSAVLGGNVTADGGSSITERGICYGIDPIPTIANSKVAMGSGTGEFSAAVTGLNPNTTYHVRAYATNIFATSYGSEMSFITTQPQLATVATAEATSIGSSSANLGGNVTNDGNITVTERGICYSTAQNPTTANTKIAIGSGIGTFSSIISGLLEGKPYYVKAYAINSLGTAYGSEITFTTAQSLLATVTTADATGIGSSSASLGGNVTSDGNSTVTERGICYSTSQSPTTGSTKVVIGSGTGTFSGIISGLLTSTTYYVKAYAINSKGTAYGNEVSFKTIIELTLASLTTDTPASITSNSVLLGGNVTRDGNSTVTERGICYSTSQNPTTNSTKVAIGTGVGAYSNTISGLTSNTTWYVRAYAINSQGTAYGNQVNFATLGSIPSVTTKEVTNILETTAIAGGIVLSDEGSVVTERGVCYGTLPDPTIYDSKIASGSGVGGFSIPLNTLIPNITYNVRAYAINKNGTAYGENKSFKTLDAYYTGFENGMPEGWTGMWSVSTDSPYEGFFCLKSVNSGDSIVFTRTITRPSGGQISFFSKGSYYIEFYIDNVLQSRFNDYYWTLKTFPITTGSHKFTWVNKGGIVYIDYFICPK